MIKHEKPILLIGSSLTSPDLEYITGFRTSDPVVFLQIGNNKVLVVPELELGRAVKTCVNIQSLTPGMLRISKLKRRRLSQWALALLKKYNLRCVTVPSSFPFGIAEALKKNGIRVVPSEERLFPERAVKTIEEIKKIRDVQQTAVIAMRTAVTMIAHAEITYNRLLRYKGAYLTAEKIKQVITEILISRNCICRDLIVAGGLDAANPHDQGHGPLPADQSIVLDIFPQHMTHGYWGDLTRSVVRGNPSAKLKNMYWAVKSAQSAALNRLKPGIKCSTVHKAASAELIRRGFETHIHNGIVEGFIHGTGHGVGLAIHEDPSISNNDTRLRAGNVITVEPGLYYSNIGGIRIEDTVVITKTGWKYLVPCEKKFEN